LSKAKEKKLNSIKLEIEEIKNFIASNNNLGISEQIEPDLLNKNTNDTLTLTNIVKKEEDNNNNSDLDEIKKELKALKASIDNNENLLREVLLKIK
tara:strand:+ start:105 stop:392 length:288 start_codon:yes stop_codon:yes gene_type:complete